MTFPPAVLGGLRYAIAGAGMLLALRVAGRRVGVRIRDVPPLLVVAALLLVGGNGLVMWAEQTVPSGLTALLVATVALWMSGLAALLPPREGLTGRAVAGIALGFLGVVVLVWPELRSPAGYLWGELALIVASLSWACGSLYSRRAGILADPLTATAWEMLFGGAMMLGLALANGSLDLWLRALQAPGAWRESRDGFIALAYLITVGSWIGFTAYIWLLSHASAARVATYAYVNPVIAVILGWLILGEALTLEMVAGSIIVVAAVVLVTSARVDPEVTPAIEAIPPASLVEGGSRAS